MTRPPERDPATPHGRPSSAPSRTKPARSPALRHLHAGHFAFMRAAVQGLDLHESWDRYLHVEGELSDKRLVSSTLQWIRAAFAAAAQREDRFGMARLLRLDVSQIADPAYQLPNLAQFAQEEGLEDESQAEQIRAYERRYGRATQRLRRRAQLIERQLEALRWLQDQVAQAPRAGDALAAWLHPSLAGQLHASDLFTLAQLVERINGIGRNWHASIRAVGAGKARRIERWLRDHVGSLEMQLGSHVERARQQIPLHELAALVQPASEIRPLEKLRVPAAIDGTQGLYRRAQAHCLLGAGNDYQAVLAWLRAKTALTPAQKTALNARRRHPGKVQDKAQDRDENSATETDMAWLQTLSHTQRAYRKEAERFLLWALVKKGKAMSSMSNEDCSEYRDFLADPQPRSHWCGARSRERWSPLWRPFEGPLQASAQRHAVTILNNLYRFLVDQNYLMGNPWSQIRVPNRAVPRVNAGRSLSLAQWDFVQERLALLSPGSSSLRLQFGLRFLYATGLRLSEAVAAKVDDLNWVEYPGDASDDAPLQGWLLSVVGKGGKLRQVPVPLAVMEELQRYLASRGLSREPHDPGNQGAHLLGKVSDMGERLAALHGTARFDPRDGLAATSFYDLIKAFFAGCATARHAQGDEQGAQRFAQASTHWMRHSHASHAIACGMPIEIAQQNLGHASLATTTVYVTTEAKRRMKAMEKFWAA